MGRRRDVSRVAGSDFPKMEVTDVVLDDSLHSSPVAAPILGIVKGIVYEEGTFVDKFLGEYVGGGICVSLCGAIEAGPSHAYSWGMGRGSGHGGLDSREDGRASF